MNVDLFIAAGMGFVTLVLISAIAVAWHVNDNRARRLAVPLIALMAFVTGGLFFTSPADATPGSNSSAKVGRTNVIVAEFEDGAMLVTVKCDGPSPTVTKTTAKALNAKIKSSGWNVFNAVADFDAAMLADWKFVFQVSGPDVATVATYFASGDPCQSPGGVVNAASTLPVPPKKPSPKPTPAKEPPVTRVA
jgi:hypothetical protein